MGEKVFTKGYKHNLAYHLDQYFKSAGIDLEVREEYSTWIGPERNQIDIAIRKVDDEQLLIGIELEIISDTNQVLINYDKFKRWVHASPNRKRGLLQLFATESKPRLHDYYDLVAKSYDDCRKNLNFWYEYMIFDIQDFRRYRAETQRVIEESVEFDVRLFALVWKVFGKKYLPSK